MLSKRTLLPIKQSPIRKIGILGLGRTGMATIKLALKNHIEPYIFDDKPNFIPMNIEISSNLTMNGHGMNLMLLF